MADPFAPVNQGAPIKLTAKTMNAVLLAAQDFARRKYGATGGDRTNGAADRTRFFNTTRSALDEFAIVGYGDPAVSPLIDSLGIALQPAFFAAAPQAGKPFAVLAEPAPSGGSADAVATGPALCAVDVSDPTHTRAAASDGNFDHLVSASAGGVPILWKETGTGIKWAMILMGADQDGPDATPTVRGWVGTGTQSFGGTKTFMTGINVAAGNEALFFNAINTESGWVRGVTEGLEVGIVGNLILSGVNAIHVANGSAIPGMGQSGIDGIGNNFNAGICTQLGGGTGTAGASGEDPDGGVFGNGICTAISTLSGYNGTVLVGTLALDFINGRLISVT
jgi:hypothetical protein